MHPWLRLEHRRSRRCRGVKQRLRTAWRLYNRPGNLFAALAKAAKVLVGGGPLRLWALTRDKLSTPQLPASILGRHDAKETLEFEHRWVLAGQSLPSRSRSVSVIIPTKGNSERVRACLGSIGMSVLPDARIDILIVNNGQPLDIPAGTIPQVRVRPESSPFNWSAYNNRAVAETTGEYLLFLNDDVAALHGGWLDAMLTECNSPTVGVVGAKLVYPNGRIQHIGISLDCGPEGGHEYKFEPRDFAGPSGKCTRSRPVDAVTGACLLTRRACFDALGGFDEHFAESYNDVDYCLRARAQGYTTVVTPHAELIHWESLTRPLRVLERERRLFRSRWLEG